MCQVKGVGFEVFGVGRKSVGFFSLTGTGLIKIEGHVHTLTHIKRAHTRTLTQNVCKQPNTHLCTACSL